MISSLPKKRSNQKNPIDVLYDFINISRDRITRVATSRTGILLYNEPVDRITNITEGMFINLGSTAAYAITSSVHSNNGELVIVDIGRVISELIGTIVQYHKDEIRQLKDEISILTKANKDKDESDYTRPDIDEQLY